ncbi:MAG: hypothetical protein LLG14_23500 [Nocardiaceae bacterium]|nr:hypothetical protein [Nocardiaceae bacterium]
MALAIAGCGSPSDPSQSTPKSMTTTPNAFNAFNAFERSHTPGVYALGGTFTVPGSPDAHIKVIAFNPKIELQEGASEGRHWAATKAETCTDTNGQQETAVCVRSVDNTVAR